MRSIRDRLAKLEAITSASERLPATLEFVCEDDGRLYGVEIPPTGRPIPFDYVGRTWTREAGTHNLRTLQTLTSQERE